MLYRSPLRKQVWPASGWVTPRGTKWPVSSKTGALGLPILHTVGLFDRVSVVLPLSWHWLTSNLPRSLKDRTAEWSLHHHLAVAGHRLWAQDLRVDVPTRKALRRSSVTERHVREPAGFLIEAAFIDGEGAPMTHSSCCSSLCWCILSWPMESIHSPQHPGGAVQR